MENPEPQTETMRCHFCASDDLNPRESGAVECVPCGAIALRRGAAWDWIGPETRATLRQALESVPHPVESED